MVLKIIKIFQKNSCFIGIDRRKVLLEEILEQGQRWLWDTKLWDRGRWDTILRDLRLADRKLWGCDCEAQHCGDETEIWDCEDHTELWDCEAQYCGDGSVRYRTMRCLLCMQLQLPQWFDFLHSVWCFSMPGVVPEHRWAIVLWQTCHSL